VVAARYQNKWYLALVTAACEGRYSVRYADNSDGVALAASDLLPVAKSTELKEGERVIACYYASAEMRPGTLLERTAQGFRVQWESGQEPTEAAPFQIARL
jgi:hypothetical protein